MATKTKTKTPALPRREAPIFQIGGASPESVREVRAAIVEIIGAPYADREVKLAALQAIAPMFRVENVHLENCTISA